MKCSPSKYNNLPKSKNRNVIHRLKNSKILKVQFTQDDRILKISKKYKAIKNRRFKTGLKNKMLKRKK